MLAGGIQIENKKKKISNKASIYAKGKLQTVNCMHDSRNFFGICSNLLIEYSSSSSDSNNVGPSGSIADTISQYSWDYAERDRGFSEKSPSDISGTGL